MKTPFEPLNGYPYRQYTKDEIKTVCMYCEKVLSNPDGIITSHGICQPCLERETENMDIAIEYGVAANG